VRGRGLLLLLQGEGEVGPGKDAFLVGVAGSQCDLHFLNRIFQKDWGEEGAESPAW
jgi:hypothetical protein